MKESRLHSISGIKIPPPSSRHRRECRSSKLISINPALCLLCQEEKTLSEFHIVVNFLCNLIEESTVAIDVKYIACFPRDN